VPVAPVPCLELVLVAVMNPSRISEAAINEQELLRASSF
jgi:hypothetical protein